MAIELLAKRKGPMKKPKQGTEKVFATAAYTGTGGAITIPTGLDLTKGGLVWMKRRNSTTSHNFEDSVRGAMTLSLNSTSGESASVNNMTFDNGSVSMNTTSSGTNFLNATYVAWAFAKAERFMDIVKYVGDGNSVRQIPHSLGVKPGMIIVKRTDSTSNWAVWHRGVVGEGSTAGLSMNTTNAKSSSTISSTPCTETIFSPFLIRDHLGAEHNTAGVTYVAYIFAHDSANADGHIYCGSYTGSGSTAQNIDCGWQPQFVLIKNASGSGNWTIFDTARGMGANNADDLPLTIAAASEGTAIQVITPIPRGFRVENSNSAYNASGASYIFMAIRRPGSQVPRSGTDVFAAVTSEGTGSNFELNVPFTPDLIYSANRTISASKVMHDRVRSWRTLYTDATTSEQTTNSTQHILNFSARSVRLGTSANANASGYNYVHYLFARAKGFFDVSYYEGTGSPVWAVHGLQAVPEMIWIKNRNSNYDWVVYHKDLSSPTLTPLQLTNTNGVNSAVNGFSAPPDDSLFKLTGDPNVNFANYQYVAYLFASVPGVSKVGSFVGNGAASQVIDCGFTTGARFILIRRWDANGSNWIVFDASRGIVSGGGEKAGLFSASGPEDSGSFDYIAPHPSGFELVSPTALNAYGQSYIYFAIA